MTEYLQNNLLPLIAVVVGSIGLFIKLYSLARAKKNKALKSYSQTFGILSKQEEFPKLNISFDNTRIESFYITKIILINSGLNTIDKTDLKTIDQLRIEIHNDIKLLSYRIIFQTKEANNFNLKEEVSNNLTKSIVVSFDFIDSSHGAIIEIGHSRNQKDNFKITGTVKGVERISTEKTIDSLKGGLSLFFLRTILYILAIGLGSHFLKGKMGLYVVWLVLLNIALFSTWEYFNKKITYKNDLLNFYEKF